MEKKQKIILISIFIVIIFMIGLLVNDREKASLSTTSTTYSKTIGWGIKRANNNKQPDVGELNKKMLEENNGICLGKETEKVIYLTFDEGYEAGYTEKILNTLKDNNVKATFFITSHYLNTASDLVERMINDGHLVGNHTPKFLMLQVNAL